MLVSLVAVVGTYLWFVSRSASIGDLVDGQIVESTVDRIDIARRSALGILSIALAAVPLWCGVAATWARRSGADIRGEVRCYTLSGVAVAVSAVTFVLDADERGPVSFVGTLICLAGALWAIPVTLSIQDWFGRRTVVLKALPTTWSFVVIASWVGGLQRPVRATDSIEALSFFGALQVVLVLVLLILVAVSTADVEEAIRLAPSNVSHRSTPEPDDSDS